MTSLQQTAMGGGSATAKTASYVLVAADAGTTVAMNAAGATTITVNTGLFAAVAPASTPSPIPLLFTNVLHEDELK